MKPVEPRGRAREKKTSAEIMEEAAELADNPEQRENTMYDRFLTNLSGSSFSDFSKDASEGSEKMEIDRSVLPEKTSEASSYENAMIILSDLRDSFLNSFHSVSGDRTLYNIFSTSIHKIEAGMRDLGMEVEEFNPLTSLSGLSTNDEILVNAQEVVANTTKRYNLYKIASINAEVYRGVPSVSIVIEGEDNGDKFRAAGRIVADNDFSGNEAIDFVTKDGNCALGVKAISLGRFIDVSDRFSIDLDVSVV